jgi:Uncharacterized protein conserved in bacteria
MTNISEKRTSPIGLRLFPSLKKALEKAAADDSRSTASLVEKILTEWLKEKGYLAK